MKGLRSVGSKIALSYLGIIITAILVLTVVVDRVVEARYVATVARGLERQALLARRYLDHLANERTDPSRIADLVGSSLGCRVTLIARDGIVLADNRHDTRTMDNHLHRPEVQQAIRSGRGRSTRFSKTVGVEMLYVALTVSSPRSSVAILRLALPLWDAEAAARHIRAVILLTGLITATLSGLVSVVLARSITRPIAEVSRAADQIATGDLRQHVTSRSRDEVGQLASAFNVMSSRLAGMIDEMAEEKSKVETILSRMADGIIVTDRRGEVVLFNKSAQHFFGVGESEALGRTLAESTLHYDLSQKVGESLTRKTIHQVEIQLRQPIERVLACYVAPVETEGADHHGAVVVLHDLTEIRRLETVRKDFVANVSHELRTPVASIRAMAETLLMGAKDEADTAERFLATIHEESIRLTNLLNDLLAISAIESGKKELRKQVVWLKPTVDRVLHKLGHQIETKGLVVTLDVTEQLQVNADTEALEQILMNLIDNAIKYTPSARSFSIRGYESMGGWELGSEGTDVLPTHPHTRTPTHVVMEVADTGIGIPSTDLPRVFERFYRVDKARSREMGGTGLGLSIVKHLVEAHGGTVQVHSELGKGSTFVTIFPS